MTDHSLFRNLLLPSQFLLVPNFATH